MVEPSASTRSVVKVLDEKTDQVDPWLVKADFYHGYLPREDIPYLLKKHGDFLARTSEVNTVRWGKAKKKETIISVLIDPDDLFEDLGSSESRQRMICDKVNDYISLTEYCYKFPTSTSLNYPTLAQPVPYRNPVPYINVVRNVIIYREKLHFFVEKSTRFALMRDLFAYYASHPVRINKANIILKRGIGLAKWELQHKAVTIGELLGEGAFGEVRKGTLMLKNGQRVPVAVKTLKSSCAEGELSKAKIKEMMKEARLMRDLKHPNVVLIYGVALLEHPLYIVLEYISGGALDVYLRKHKQTIDERERLYMTMGAAWGMEYLHRNCILHRDIAARNCLYDNKKTVKISDFGLSRRGTTYTMKTAKKMAIKWMAPESVSEFTFSQKTDVYSYGVLVYEIFSCNEPYEGASNIETKRMITEGVLNKFPEETPALLAEFIKEKVWDRNPDKRAGMIAVYHR